MKSGAILLPINLSRRIVEANAAIATIQSDIIKCNVEILSAIITQSTKSGQAIIDCIGQSSSVNIASWFCDFFFCLFVSIVPWLTN